MTSYSLPLTKQPIEGSIQITQNFPQYTTQALYQNTYALSLTTTSTNIAAGNQSGAAAAASTQFGVINPATSTKLMILMKFYLGVVSGTPPAGSVFHGFLPTTGLTASSPGGTIMPLYLGGKASVMTPWVSATGSALTGATTGPSILRATHLSFTATSQTTTSPISAVSQIDGDIIIPPGYMWLPLFLGAGSSFLNSYSITWIEAGI